MTPPVPSALADALRDLDVVIRSLDLRWYVFGAQAAILHGASRLSADADVTVFLDDAKLEGTIDALQRAGFPCRVADPAGFAREHRVLPCVHERTQLPVDIVLGSPGIEEEIAGRSVRRQVEGTSIPVASSEDVVAMKIFAGRPKDLEDALEIILAQPNTLNVEISRGVLQALENALDRSDLSPVLDDLLRRADSGAGL